MDLSALIKPSIDRSLYSTSLEELSLLCLMVSQRCPARERTQKPCLQRFNKWIDDQLNSHDLSQLDDADDERLLGKIDSIVQELSRTPAHIPALALQQVCNGIETIFNGEVSSWEDLLTSETISEFRDFVDQGNSTLLIQRLAHSKPDLRVLEIGSWRSSPSNTVLES